MDQKQPQLYLTSEEIVSFIFLFEGYASLTEPNGTQCLLSIPGNLKTHKEPPLAANKAGIESWLY